MPPACAGLRASCFLLGRLHNTLPLVPQPALPIGAIQCSGEDNATESDTGQHKLLKKNFKIQLLMPLRPLCCCLLGLLRCFRVWASAHSRPPRILLSKGNSEQIRLIMPLRGAWPGGRFWKVLGMPGMPGMAFPSRLSDGDLTCRVLT